jgi:hypothetical protein
MKRLIGLVLLFVGFQAQATIVTRGDLTTDDTTNFITDVETGRLYTRLGVNGTLSYDQTVTATQSGGAFDGWSIADSIISDEFISSMLGVPSSPCTGAANYNTNCGVVDTWADGLFGASYSITYDYYMYISTAITPGGQVNEIGLAEIRLSNSVITDRDDWGSYGAVLDFQDISLLLYKEVASVPEPSIIALMVIGLAGLGFARRRKTQR